MNIMRVRLADVWLESNRSRRRYGPYRSSHEGYGVLAEEVDELLEAIRANDLSAVRNEAIQVASVALRIASENSPEYIERSGFKEQK